MLYLKRILDWIMGIAKWLTGKSRQRYTRSRFGKDLPVEVTIHSPKWGTEYWNGDAPLAGRDLKMLVINPSGDVTELAAVIQEGSLMYALFEGRQQRVEGLHHLVVVEDLGALGQDVVRWDNFVLLDKKCKDNVSIDLEGRFGFNLSDALEYIAPLSIHPSII